MAAALSPFLIGPDQVVAVAMSQDNRQIVASHLGILKAGGIGLGEPVGTAADPDPRWSRSLPPIEPLPAQVLTRCEVYR